MRKRHKAKPSLLLLQLLLIHLLLLWARPVKLQVATTRAAFACTILELVDVAQAHTVTVHHPRWSLTRMLTWQWKLIQTLLAAPVQHPCWSLYSHLLHSELPVECKSPLFNSGFNPNWSNLDDDSSLCWSADWIENSWTGLHLSLSGCISVWTPHQTNCVWLNFVGVDLILLKILKWWFHHRFWYKIQFILLVSSTDIMNDI